MSHLFTKKKDEKMIEMIKANPILYDTTHENYRNMLMKYQIWDCISKSLGIPIQDVKKRWRHSRDQYLKKLRRHEAGLPNGNQWEDVMKRYSFLSAVRQKKPASEHSDEENEEQEHEVLFVMPPAGHNESSNQSDDDEDKLSNYIPASRKRRKHSERSTSIISVSEEIPNRDNVTTTYSHSSVETPRERGYHEEDKSLNHKFFESMADMVCGFPPRMAAQARLKVCQMLTEMELQLHSEPPAPQWQTSGHVKRE